MRLKNLLRPILGFPLTILALGFIAKLFLDSKEIIFESLLHANILFLVSGLFFFCLFFTTKAFAWILILKKRGQEFNLRQTIYKYSYSEIKRYIPGSIFAFLGRIETHSDTISKKETLKGIGIEAALLSLASLIVCIPALGFLLSKFVTGFPFILILPSFLLITAAIFLHPKTRRLVTSFFDIFSLLVLSWVFYGLACVLVTISIAGVSPFEVLNITSLFVLAWLFGYLLFVVPMGLGVREATTVGFLSFFVSAPVAAAISVMTRICMIGGELIFLVCAQFFSKLHRNSLLLRINPYYYIVSVLALIYFFYFSTFSIFRHDAFYSGRFDLGNMSQTVWNTAHGRFFMLTNPDGINNVSRLAVHSDFILVLFAPLYLIWSDPKILLISQTAILAAGGFFVFLLGREIVKNEKLALAFTVSYYLNFWLGEQNIFDFHAVSLSTTFLLATFYFVLKKKYFLFGLFLFLAVITKENIFLTASFFGIYLAWKRKLYIPGIIIAAACIAMFFFLSSYAIPQARGSEHFALGSYKYLGDSTGGIIKNIFLKPDIVFSQLANQSTLEYLNHHLMPTGYLAIISPLYLVFTIPEAAIYLLSGNYEYRAIGYHFGAAILPFIYIASMFSVVKLKKKLSKLITEKFLFYYILLFTFWSCYLYSPIIGMRFADIDLFSMHDQAKVEKYLQLIPPEASVTASNNVGAHLSQRELIYVLPNAINEASYVVLYKEPSSTLSLVDRQFYENIVADSKLNFYIFKKKIAIVCSTCKP